MKAAIAAGHGGPGMLAGRMWTGTYFALAAGLMWGLVFVGPLLLPEYPAVLLSAGRYLAFGLIALPLAWLDRTQLARLTRADWIEALKLAAVGNLLYYVFLAAAIQRAGGPLPTVIVGTLPVVIAITANLRETQRVVRVPWRRLAPSLMMIAAGIACVNQAEIAAVALVDVRQHALGALLAIGAVACWTWYPLRNADWLRAHADRNPRAWATAQGVATLPLALATYAAFGIYAYASGLDFALPFGPRPQAYVALMLAIGLLASWLGTLCWNEASQRLPPGVAGQLIVFETLAALAYAFALRGTWPPALAWFGAALLFGGVLLALRHQRPSLPAQGPA
jgi:drug/metabolite transporter (DMT)-like permease